MRGVNKCLAEGGHAWARRQRLTSNFRASSSRGHSLQLKMKRSTRFIARRMLACVGLLLADAPASLERNVSCAIVPPITQLFGKVRDCSGCSPSTRTLRIAQHLLACRLPRSWSRGFMSRTLSLLATPGRKRCAVTRWLDPQSCVSMSWTIGTGSA